MLLHHSFKKVPLEDGNSRVYVNQQKMCPILKDMHLNGAD